MLRFLIVFLFLRTLAFGQDPDTLLTYTLKIENDTEKVNQLYTIGFELKDKDPQLAYSFAQNCEWVAKKSQSQKHIAKSKNLLGILFYHHGHYKRAVVYFEEYLSNTIALNNISGIAFGYTNLGNAYLALGHFEKVEHFYLKAIAYHNSLNDKKNVANVLINLAVLKHNQKQLDAARENYLKAFELGKQLYDYEIKAICLNNLAQVYSDQGNNEKALAYNYDALELRDLMGLDLDVCDSHLSIAEIALKQNNTILAEENLGLALVISDKIGYAQGKINYYKLFSELEEQKKNYQSSFKYFKLYKQLNDSILLTEGSELKFNFKEIEEPKSDFTKKPIKNMLLLALLSLLLIVIPFVLIRYKR